MSKINPDFFDNKYMRALRRNLYSKIDGNTELREDILTYIDYVNDNNTFGFFWNMVPLMRFLFNEPKAIAYTTPDKLLYLNPPKETKEEAVWDFIFCHECMHQVWDTFGVQDKIKNVDGSVDGQLLNIASDCVINDYLRDIFKKKAPDFGIFPEVLEKECGVKFDRRTDTQYTLYLKLLEARKKNQVTQEQLDNMSDRVEEQMPNEEQSDSKENPNQQQNQQQNPFNDGGKKSGNQKNGNNDQNQSGQGQGNGQDGQEGQSNQGGQGGQKGAQGEKNGPDLQGRSSNGSSKSSGDKGQRGIGSGTDDDEEAGEAKDATSKNQKNGKNTDKDGNPSSSQNGDDSNNKGGKENIKNATATGGSTGNDELPEASLEEIRKYAEKTIAEAAQKLSGDFGKFIKKCKASFDNVGKVGKNSGMMAKSTKGNNAAWAKNLQQEMSVYLSQRVNVARREYEATYKRIKRGVLTNFGDPLQKGRLPKKDKMVINIAFYIDVSGSMDHCKDKVFDAANLLCDTFEKQYKANPAVKECEFKFFGFDNFLYKVDRHKRYTKSGGGTMPFTKLCQHVKKESSECLINVILTDAELGNDNSKSQWETLLKELNGILIFIPNQNAETYKQLAEKNPYKMKYIQADYNFTI